VAYEEVHLHMDAVDRRSEVETGLKLIAQRLAELHEVIETLRRAERLRPDAAAKLAMYEQNEKRLLSERERLELERASLMARTTSTERV
jgi:hypothetical protein